MLKLYREDDIQDIADAIREKNGEVTTYTVAEMGEAIRAIETGTDTSDATVLAGDVRAGQIFYGASGKGTGTLAEVQQATPSISVSAGGLITASSQQDGGIVDAGTKSATQQLLTMAGQTVTPGSTQQTIQTAGKYMTGDIVVGAASGTVFTKVDITNDDLIEVYEAYPAPVSEWRMKVRSQYPMEKLVQLNLSTILYDGSSRKVAQSKATLAERLYFQMVNQYWARTYNFYTGEITENDLEANFIFDQGYIDVRICTRGNPTGTPTIGTGCYAIYKDV